MQRGTPWTEGWPGKRWPERRVVRERGGDARRARGAARTRTSPRGGKREK